MPSSLALAEALYMQHVLAALESVDWASPLLRRLMERGGLIPENKALLFEARFAYELSRKNLHAEYEHPAGVGNSTIEFKIATSKEWLIELVSVCESEGVRNATNTNGPFTSTFLSSPGSQTNTPVQEQKQSEEAEMITAQHKIGEKVFCRGQPTKFPEPANNIHAILVDMRGYLGEGGDSIDYRQIAYGEPGVPVELRHLVHYWQGSSIAGLFQELDHHPARGAPYLQARVHWLGFIAEKEYMEGEISSKAYWLPNPRLVTKDNEEEIKKSFPLH